jgi:hypothetical protein
MPSASIIKRYNNSELSTLDHPVGPTTQLTINPCLTMYCYPSQSVNPHPYPTKLRLLPPNFTVPDFVSSQQKKRESQQSKENAEPSVTAGILYDTFSSPTDLPISKSTLSSSQCSSSCHSSSCHSSFHHSPSSFTSPLPPCAPHNLCK